MSATCELISVWWVRNQSYFQQQLIAEEIFSRERVTQLEEVAKAANGHSFISQFSKVRWITVKDCGSIAQS